MIDTLLQGYTAAAFFYAGIILGICYDGLRIIRILADSRAATHLTDGLFVIILGVVAYGVFYTATSGVIRGYGLALLCAGAAAQQWAFGLPICKRIVKRRK